MPLAAPDVDFLRSFVAKRSGNVLRSGQGNLIETQLAPVAKGRGLENVEQLVNQLRGVHPPSLAELVAEAVTVNETSFFRDIHPFDALHKQIIPELVKNNPRQEVRIWCAACSSGQEPLSIAMVIREHLPHMKNIRIVATDLCEEVLAKSRSGEYSQLEVNRGLQARKLVRFFDRRGSVWKAKPELMDLIEHRHMNLTTKWPSIGHFDIVFIRNVLIYFDMTAKAEILRRVQQVLRPHGYLFIGGAETIIGLEVPFRREEIDATVCYRQGTS